MEEEKKYTMSKLAEKGGMTWLFFALVPIALVVGVFGEAFGFDTKTIIAMQAPALFLQLLSLYMVIRYSEEILF